MKRKILIIGVKKDIVSGIGNRLEEDKFELVDLASVKDAFNYVNTRRLSVIILNNILPGGGSYREFCVFVRSQEKSADLPIILLAEKPENEDSRVEALKSRLINDYIALPVSIEEVVARLNIFIELRVLQEQLEIKNILLNEVSITDELTKLHNRRYLLTRLEEEIQRNKRYNYPVSCLLIDVDFFKKVNDKFGHQAGDSVLIELARLLKNTIRSVDIIGRYGGEEFLAILPYTTLDKAVIVAERLRSAVSAYSFTALSIPMKLTLSVGATFFTANAGITIDKIIETVDGQLYLAKQSGRNNVKAIDCR